MSKNMCITGVSGFIGRHVAEEALRRGYRVTGLDRNQSPTSDFEFVNTDIRDTNRLTHAMRSQDYVIHLAAVTSNVEFVRNPVDSYDINASGFLGVIDAAAKNGCKVFVYASSAAVYLDRFSEDALIDVRKQSNHYAKTKIMNEMAARSYEEIYRMKTIALRYFNVYGNGENQKGDYASIITLFLKAKKNGEPLVLYGDGTQARDLINVVDTARITLDLLEKGSYDVYNIGTGTATKYVTIAELIDMHRIRYIPNPLPSYQLYTRAETGRLKEALGDYPFLDVKTGLEDMRV